MTDKTKNKVVTIIFILFIFSFSILNILKKDEDISISERRKLNQFPTFSFNNLFNGNFFKNFDKYTTDQFIKRDEFRKLKINIELLYKGNYNDLYLYNNYIVKQLYPLNEESINNLTNKINYIKNTYLKDNNIYFTIIPDKNYFVPNRLKLDYNKLENIMKQNLSDMTYINIFPLLTIDNYYQTDTHWKEETLIEIANKIASKMNSSITTNFTIEKVSPFKGVYSTTFDINSNDTINILTNDTIKNSTVYNYENNKTTPIYDMSKIDYLDKYDIYLSGATPLITITTNTNIDKELIIFRDSFGSSLAPLLTSGYKKITLVDTRYISTKVLKEYIDFSNKDILFMYSTILINDSSSLRS